MYNPPLVVYIVAEALVHQAPIVSRDQVLRRSGVVEIIW